MSERTSKVMNKICGHDGGSCPAEPKVDPARLAADLAAATAEMETMPAGLEKAETRMLLNLVHCFVGLAEMGTLGVDSGMELLAILRRERTSTAGR